MIRICDLKKSFGDRVILKGANYHFTEGERVALVGANGAGKTTLLNLIAGLDEADGGSVVQPRDFNVGYLPQEPNPAPLGSVVEECCAGHRRLQALACQRDEFQSRLVKTGDEEALRQFEAAQNAFTEAGGDALESRAKGILAGLGFKTAQLSQSPMSLSGGWRMRLELAKVFLNDPDFLILDEPTNHLDLPSLVWVESFLRQFKGCVLFVSHDRGLLNRLASVVIHLASGTLREYKGNFDSFLEQKESVEQQDAKRLEALARRKAELSGFIERFGAKATKAKQAQARAKMLSRLESLEETLEAPEKESSIALKISHPPASGRAVLQIEKLSIGYEAVRPLAADIDLTILRGQKVAVIGANGIGKSTLLQSVARAVPPLAGVIEEGHNVSCAYFAQDQMSVLDAHLSVLENVMKRTALSEREARALLGQFLFRGDDVFKKVSILSGGEKNRVGLAILFSQSANLLVLDEPTNHLDMRSAEVLSAVLQDFEGSVLCVSHDREFINSFASHIFVMLADGRFELFEGNLDDYPRLAAVRGFPNILDPQHHLLLMNPDEPSQMDRQTRMQRRTESQTMKRERQKLARRIEEAEVQMARSSEQIRVIESEIEACGADYSKIQVLSRDLQECQAKLAEHEAQWLELNETLEQLQSE